MKRQGRVVGASIDDVDGVPLLAEVIPSTQTRQLEVDLPSGWTAMNPSIAAAGDGFLAIVRTVNWAANGDGSYTVSDPDGAFRTQNYLAVLDSDLQVQTVEPMVNLLPGGRFGFPVEGVEDARPLQLPNGTWRVTGTMRDRNPSGTCQMVMFDLEGPVLRNPRILSSAEYHRHEKNWMPFLDDGQLCLLYSAAPTVVARYDEPTGSLGWDRVTPFPADGVIRGSSQGLRVDGGWLFAIHEVVGEGVERDYTHRLVLLNDDYRISRQTPKFRFAGESVEFCNGLAVRDGHLVFSFGVRDQEAWLARVPLSEALALLEPLAAGALLEAPEDSTNDSHDEFSEVGLGQTEPGFDAPAVKVVSVTLSGNAQDLIGDALRSVVDWVDECVLIDTGITDKTLEIARTVAGDKLTVREWAWQNDYALARNTALDMAAETGADWAVMLDTDERLVLEGDKLREALPLLQVSTINFMDVSNYYEKPRMFRLPRRGEYEGPTHEAFAVHPGELTGRSAHARFWEVPRHPDAYLRKARRDIAILEPHTEKEPENPRWWYYLGDAYSILGEREKAIDAFLACEALNGWPEEAGWACYRAAKEHTELGNFEEAIHIAARGLSHHSGIAELPWIAAWACYQLERWDMAIYWAHLATATGFYDGIGENITRLIFRHLPAMWEGPYDILRHAYRQLGMADAAALADVAFDEALAKRNESLKPPAAVLPWETDDASDDASDDDSAG